MSPDDAITCRELRLRQFRNFEQLELALPPPGVAIIGENGAGKSNLLEALYYLEIFRSFRGAPDDQLVRFGADAFHVRGRFGGHGVEHEVTAAYQPKTRSKRITVDGGVPDRIGDAIGRVGAVIFSPSDIAIIGGAPAERRRFLDILLSLNRPGYLDALQRYRGVLRRRNAALRQGSTPAAVAAWNPALVQAGARIVTERAGWVARNADAFARRYVAIGAGAAGRLAYRAGYAIDGDATSIEIAAAAFARELDRTAVREREQGSTRVGPHRDDLAVRLDTPEGPLDLRDYGSGGQNRTAAIALRMVEADTIRAARGRPPLVLLDDVFAELDAARSHRVLEMLGAERHGQIVLTAPKATDVQITDPAGFAARLEVWRIEKGRVFT